jgi:RHS repeat-associated protein
MDFVWCLMLALCAGVFCFRSAAGKGRSASSIQNSKRRSVFLLTSLLLGSGLLPNLAHADAASCEQVAAWLSSDACNGVDPYDSVATLSCYTTPDPTVSGVTEVWQIFTAYGASTVDLIGEYDCSANPVANSGSGIATDGGDGQDNGGAGSGSGGNGGTPSDCTCDDSTGAPNFGDPINASTGSKYLQDDDYLGSRWLRFRRFYNSGFVTSSAMGTHWRHSFDRSLALINSPATVIQAFRPDGKQESFTKSNGAWATDPSIPDQLVEIDNAQGTPTGYTLFIAAARQFENYNASGQLQTVTDETGQGITLSYSTSSTPGNIAPGAGLLLTVTDPKGRQLNFSYSSSGQLHQVTEPDGGSLTYSYDSSTGNLLSVEYPDGKTRQYAYNEASLTGGTSLPSAMTGIVDEAGVRYENTSYNANGLATSSSFAGSVGTTTFTYNSSGTATVQFPLGTAVTMGFNVTTNGLNQVQSLSQSCGTQCGERWQNLSYNAQGYPASYTDFNGNITATTYNNVGLLTQKINAQGTSNQRTTNITWNTTLRVPLTRTVLDVNNNTVSSTQWVYNGGGQVLARCDIDPTDSADSGYTCSNSGTVPSGVRRWTYTYCTTVGTGCPLVGLMLTATGPRTDLTQTTSYTYYTSSSATGCGTPGDACYQAGDLQTLTDALGHVTTIASYDADGRITRLVDPNGVDTDMTYTPRGWLATRTVGGAETQFGYTAYGAVQTITDPDGVTTTFGYDTAHRLTKITDALGNYIQYTLDAAGDKTGEQVYDSSGTLHKSLTRTFNTLGQLTTVVDGLNNTVFNASTSGSYDANGNLIQSTDALGIQQHLSYDALNRLTQTIDDYNGTDSYTPNTTTGIAYDALDRTTQVTDPSNLATTYGYDGLSDATGQVSPDTGTTSRTFDAAGDVISRTDARGVVTQYAYDALNRLTQVIYPAQPSLNITYTYDQATPISGCPNNFNIGHLTTMTDASGTTAWCYTNQGDIREVQQVINNTVYLHGYAYTSGRRLKWLQYPSGFELEYGYDADGRATTIQYRQEPGPYGSYTDSTLTSLITGVTYEPFGPVAGYTYALDGQSVTRTYDANYRLTDLVSTGLTLHFLRDAKGRIEAEGNAAGANPANETYQYDPLDRLLTLTNGSGTVEQSFTYNATGDRTSSTLAGQATQTYTYNAGTHQLNSVDGVARSVDANGNTTAMMDANGQLIGLGYDNSNHLTTVTTGGNTIGSYQYNGEGQRVWRTITQPVTGPDTSIYDPTGTGNLYGEYFAVDYREYVYLDGIVVANATDAGKAAPGINYLYADQLGTLRAVVNTSGTTTYTWPWLNNAFGGQPSQGTGTFYQRFPGQNYDEESGLYFNNNRFYDATTGRYVQSDPLGLRAGPNTYAYAGNSPLAHSDRLGLAGGGEEDDDIFDELEEMFPKLGPNEVDSWTQYETDMEQGVCLAPGATAPPPIPSLTPPPFIQTPYGDAIQAFDAASQATFESVSQGSTVYRMGTTGQSETDQAQFWATLSPLTPGYAEMYGIPQENIDNADFIEAGTVSPDTPFITRPSPGVGSNTGGAIEVVTPPGGVTLQYYITK